MIATTATIAPRVEAAKRLLRELEQHAESAMDTLSKGDGAAFLAAVEKRDVLLAELQHVVDVLAQERAYAGAWTDGASSDAYALIGEVAHAATGALESHERLVGLAQVEHNRLAAALRKTEQPDAIATQYTATTHTLRPRTFSVTG
jgi:hypothetical protein